MSVRLRLLIFAAGLALFGFLVARAGPGRLLAEFARAGWTLVPILLLWIPVFLCWNVAWWLTMHAQDAQRPRSASSASRALGAPPFWRVLTAGIAGHSLNDITPFAQVGGEPFRVAALTPWVGAERAAGGVVTYYLLHAMTNIVVWLAGIVLVLAAFPPPAPLVVPLVLVGLLLVAAIAFLFTRHRRGIVAPLVRLLRPLPLAGRLARRLEARAGRLEEVDRRITGFYHDSPGRFALAFGLDTAGRFASLLEYWLVGRAIGAPISLIQTVVIGSFAALAINLVFFMPLQAGSKEGGLYFAFQLAGLDPRVGIFAALVQRLREWTWVGVGLLLIWLAGERPSVAVTRSQN